MTEARSSGVWLGFAGVGAVATLALGALGQVAAAKLGMPQAGSSVWAGCLASFAGSLAGALPLAQEKEIAFLRDWLAQHDKAQPPKK